MYLKLTEAKTGNKMLVAEDAICVAKENKRERVVEISTMDGFFYEVRDSIEDLAKALVPGQPKPHVPISDAKTADKERKIPRMRRQRMLAPPIDKPVRKENADVIFGTGK